jgi:HlyD family secretion protein
MTTPRRPSRWRAAVLGSAVLAAMAAATWVAVPRPDGARDADGAAAATAVPTGVAALGRLRPKDGVLRLAGPSRPTAVIGQLLVEEGQAVREGAVIAVLDTLAQDEARVARLEAQLRNAQAELVRQQSLLRAGSAPVSQRDTVQLRVDVAAADLQAARAQLDADRVRAPIAGRILAVHARSGERVGPAGIVEIGQTDRMYALAEVYETDVARVRVGQRATVRSRALPQELHGTVERIGLTVGQLSVLSTDPAADTDVRVVEVLIRLDDTAPGALTNLQVEVVIQPDAG